MTKRTTQSAVRPYATSHEHLLAEMARLVLLLGHAVQEVRQRAAANETGVFQGVFLSDREMEQLLCDLAALPTGKSDEAGTEWQRLAAVREQEIAVRRAASQSSDVLLRLPRVAELFSLSRFEEQVLLLCLAPELDTRYEKLYAYLQDDLTRPRPSVELILRLLCATPTERLSARAFFAPQSALWRAHLLRYADSAEPSLLRRALVLDEPLVHFLLGTPGSRPELAPGCYRQPATVPWQQLRWPAEMKARLLALTQEHVRQRPSAERRLIYQFVGPEGTGRKTLAAALCHEIGLSLLVIDLRQVLQQGAQADATLRRLLRAGKLHSAAVYLEHGGLLCGADPPVNLSWEQVVAALEEFSSVTFLATEQPWEPGRIGKDHLWLTVSLPAPDLLVRATLWAELAQPFAVAADVDWNALTASFRLTPGQMQAALIAAHNQAQWRASRFLTSDDLYAGCRQQSNPRLSALAHKLTPRRDWADITLPAAALAQLHEICAQVKHRQTVYGHWGFQGKYAAPGLCALFYGLSGTGKTLAAEVIAHELRLDAFKIDLSSVVSKYIGETEKNLRRLFEEAEASQALLFFDEADALFGRRSEVKDAHDRYANIEINYLLQRLEAFDGLVILATNLQQHLDEAFVRRMHFAIEFPLPDAPQRARIWQQHLPASAPLAAAIDFDFLAQRLKFTGGNIRNVVRNAAFLAAAEAGAIAMKHFVRAAQREYEKAGRLCTEAEFAPYHPYLTEAQ